MSQPGSAAAIQITEVGLRDGIQNEARFITPINECAGAAAAGAGDALGPRLKRYRLEEQAAALG